MNRLTNKETKIKLSDTKRYDLQDHKMYNKLKEYEDIDEKLGIEYPVLIKALTNSMWFKHYDKKTKCTFIYNAHLYMKPLLNVYNKTIEIKEYVDNAGGYWFIDCDEVRIEDYGKTWALNKEELC